jgi:acetyl esterase
VQDWKVSPIKGPCFGKLAPALICVAEMDILKDEGKAYARKMNDAGVRADVVEFKGVSHAFMYYDDILDAGKEYHKVALQALSEALKLR